MIIGTSPGDVNQIYYALPYYLKVALTTNLRSFSLQLAAESELISPILSSCQGFSPVGGIA